MVDIVKEGGKENANRQHRNSDRSGRNSGQVQNAEMGEVIDFINDLSSKKFSGVVEIQFKRGEARMWAKVSKFRKIGGGNGQWDRK